MRSPDLPPGAPPWASGRRSLGASLLINSVAPLIAYQLVRPEVRSDALGLVIAAAIPVAWTLIRLLWGKRLDLLWGKLIGVLAVAGFGLGLLLLLCTGGNALAFKIREPALAGALGLVCLASLAVRRPVALLVLRQATGSPISRCAGPPRQSPRSSA